MEYKLETAPCCYSTTEGDPELYPNKSSTAVCTPCIGTEQPFYTPNNHLHLYPMLMSSICTWKYNATVNCILNLGANKLVFLTVKFTQWSFILNLGALFFFITNFQHLHLDWSFIEKTCKAKHEMQSVFKFSDVLFSLKSDVPPVEPSGQLYIWSPLSQTDLQVRCTPPRGSSSQPDIWSAFGSGWP